MADATLIEWTDMTWHPVTGCTVCSPGCKHCYAMKLAGSRLRNHPSRAGLTVDTPAGPVWNGQVRFNEAWLTQPLKLSRPRKIFVCGHGDLFHEDVPDAWIDRVFAVMALASWHTHQVLTKRSDRMRAYVLNPATKVRVWEAVVAFIDEWDDGKWPGVRLPVWNEGDAFLPALSRQGAAWGGDQPWPLRNVWAGVSVEDQERADERIPHLLATLAVVRWLSCEPLLGPVDLCRIHQSSEDGLEHVWESCLDGKRFSPWGGPDGNGGDVDGHPKVDWVVVGGESGAGARPMHLQNARAILRQCQSAGVACFNKQLGRSAIMDRSDAVQAVALGAGWQSIEPGSELGEVRFRDNHGGDMIEWPADLRIREMPAGASA